jgi:YVTN family beta-propeller protein
MKQKLLYSLVTILALAVQAQAQMPGKIEQTNQVLLPNGWKLKPAGTSLPLGDLPLNIQLSSSGKFLAVTNNGQSTQSIQLIDPVNEKLIDEKVIGKLWYGLAFSRDEKILYASGGNDNWIINFNIKNNKLVPADTIKLGAPYPKDKICVAGLVVNKSNTLLYAVTKEDNSLYIIDLVSRSVKSKIKLAAEAYSCLLSPDEKTLYISVWNGGELAIYNTISGKINTIKVGSHPNELLLNKKGNRLFVANANDNSVSIINTATNKVTEVVSTSLFPTKLTGSTTNGLALSKNEKTLYIANADNNCLAVFDVTIPGSSKSRGFIPVGWYPTNVKVLGDKILVSNGKGFTSMANPAGPAPIKKPDNSGVHLGATNTKEQYIGGLFKGTLSFVKTPTPELLKAYTKQVYANTPFTDKREKIAPGEAGNPIPRSKADKSPIKYVFYVIRENRTYDQVLGDMPKGNGDTSLCLFGNKITPNNHALANEFVLLDNFYVDAEVSADGHNWSTAAYATDYIEKTWPTNYGGRGGDYGSEGTRTAVDPRDGYIWDYCKRAGVTYRSYGEFAAYGKTTIKALQGNVCNQMPGFNLSIPDRKRYEIWAHDFDSLLAINKVPQLNIVRMGNDHTSGQRKGAYSVLASVADNDQAVGMLIQHLSQSPIWKESVVFSIEDDAQNGSDHVDAHRSPAYVAGPYVKRNAVVHGMYSTSGVLRTMELILGLPPMSQYDAASVPLYDCFTATPNFAPYKLKPAQIDVDERNVAVNNSSKISETFNLANEDKVPDLLLNEIVWKAVKGENAVMPAPRRSAFVILEQKKKDDDDDDD